jgi:hypothetical protein
MPERRRTVNVGAGYRKRSAQIMVRCTADVDDDADYGDDDDDVAPLPPVALSALSASDADAR